jgi:hypothetical protein
VFKDLRQAETGGELEADAHDIADLLLMMYLLYSRETDRKSV